jgi:hypothetical protein
MSATKEESKSVSISLPTLKSVGGLPAKLYLPFEDDKHKETILTVFNGMERTAIAKELATFWVPEIIAKIKTAYSEGKREITFKLQE